MPADRSQCFICRLFRAFAFSGAGAFIGGFGAMYSGMSEQNAMIAAFLGAMIAIVYMNKKTEKK